MADWKRLREEKTAAEAERIAASYGGGAEGDYGDPASLPQPAPQPTSMASMLTPFRDDAGAYSTPGAIASPREQSFTKFGQQQPPGMASEYLSTLGSNLGKASDATGLTKFGEEAVGLLSDV